MRKFCFVTLAVACVALLSSCKKHVDSMFGTIPSNYDNEMMAITKKAQEKSQNPGQVLRLMKEMADSAFNAAAEESKDEADKLVGKSVNYSIDKDVNLQISSDIKIESVELPILSRMSTVLTVSFDVATKDQKLFYVLEDETTLVGYGTFDMPSGTNNGEKQHIVMEVTSPVVPAQYQEKCKTIHFVSSATLEKDLYTIQPNMIKWRKEYKKQMNL